jgi:hypothetical protein
MSITILLAEIVIVVLLFQTKGGEMKPSNCNPIWVILLFLSESLFAYSMGPVPGERQPTQWSFWLTLIMIIIMIFLISRELFCWYWKINKMIALLTDIRDLLHKQSGNKDIISKTTESKP